MAELFLLFIILIYKNKIVLFIADCKREPNKNLFIFSEKITKIN